MNPDQTLSTLLQNNEKNIADLISQDMSLWVLAKQMLDNPEMQAQTEIIFLKIYQNTCRTIENLLLHLINSQETHLDEDSLQNLREQVQLFIHNLVENRKSELFEKMNWLEKNT